MENTLPIPTDKQRSAARYQIYEIDLPAANYRYTVVAHCFARALELVLKPTDDLEHGEMFLAWNVTNQWITQSRLAAETTFSLLKEKREGCIYFDHENGWQRIDCERLPDA
jgi:hypothetical protein